MKQLVLIVDDEMYICQIVRLVLEEAGYDVLQANSAGEGLKILRDSRPDALTVDLMMPGIKDTEFGGLDLLEHKRADPEIREIPSIVLTAVGMQADVALKQALSLGANATLRKPFSQRQLLDAVGGLFGE